MATQKKKHNTALTSLLSWRECLSSGIVIKEKSLVLKYLKDQTEPRTSRQISKDIKRERTNITRTLNMLVKEDLVEVIKYDKCETTRKKVGYYTNKQTNL